jgi:hypothetical protein
LEDRPFAFVALTSNRSASGSQIAAFLTEKTEATFRVTLTDDPAAALKLVCGETPAAALLDGRALLAALAQDCGTLAFKLQGEDNNFGVKSDIIVRVLNTDNNPPQSPRDLRGRDFCRLNGEDIATWVLPSLSLRANSVNPAGDLKGIKEYATLTAMVQGVADGVCGAAGIPSGTLSDYSPTISGGELRVLATTPELPKATADALIDQIKRNPEEFAAVLGDYKLVEAEGDDYKDFLQFAQNAGLNLRTIGQ